MVTTADVLRIDGDMDALAAHAATAGAVGRAVADTGERVFATWQELAGVYRAPEADQLCAAMGPARTAAVSFGEDLEVVEGALRRYAEEVREIQVRSDLLRMRIQEFEQQAQLAVYGLPVDGSPVRLAEERTALEAGVAAVVADFDDAQRRCANAINALSGAAPVHRPPDGDGIAEVGEFGASPATPRQVTAWWAGLTPAQREGVHRDHPDWIGNLDGVPAADRDRANRVLLEREAASLDRAIEVTEAQLAALEQQTPGGFLGAGGLLPIGAGYLALGAALSGLRDRRAAVAAVQRTAARPGRRVLLLDTSGRAPRAAVAIGDVDTAEHVAVFTPGFTSTVAGSLEGYDRDLDALSREAERQLRDAGRGDERLAVINWIGYEAPQTSTVFDYPQRSVVSPIPAAVGGVQLAGFLDGVVAARPDDPHVTALGHSYGSTTTGYALQSTAVVDDAVLFGSPGASTSDVADLRVPDGHVAVIEAHTDPTADVGAFGGDPNRLDGVVSLSADEHRFPDGRTLAESVGHSAYLTPGTTSQHNLAATAVGLPAERVHASAPEPPNAFDLLRRPWNSPVG